MLQVLLSVVSMQVKCVCIRDRITRKLHYSLAPNSKLLFLSFISGYVFLYNLDKFFFNPRERN